MLMRRVVALLAVVGVVIALVVVVNKRSDDENPPTAQALTASSMGTPAPSGDSEEHDHTCPNKGTESAGMWTCDTGNAGDAVIVSQWPFDATPTHAQRTAAKRLVKDAIADAAPYADYNFARAHGFTFDTLDETVKSVLGTPMVSQSLQGLHQGVITHLVNPARVNDGIALDPSKPDALVYATNGSRYTLVGVMFMVPTKSRAPQPGGPLTTWHYHKNPSCLDRTAPVSFRRYRPGDHLYAATGECPSGTLTERTGQMLHVWLKPSSLPAAFLSWGDSYINEALRPGQGTVRQSDGPEQIARRTSS